MRWSPGLPPERTGLCSGGVSRSAGDSLGGSSRTGTWVVRHLVKPRSNSYRRPARWEGWTVGLSWNIPLVGGRTRGRRARRIAPPSAPGSPHRGLLLGLRYEKGKDDRCQDSRSKGGVSETLGPRWVDSRRNREGMEHGCPRSPGGSPPRQTFLYRGEMEGRFLFKPDVYGEPEASLLGVSGEIEVRDGRTRIVGGGRPLFARRP